MHLMAWALTLARARPGRSNPARMAIMAMTTRSSMRVNAWLTWRRMRQSYLTARRRSSDKSSPNSPLFLSGKDRLFWVFRLFRFFLFLVAAFGCGSLLGGLQNILGRQDNRCQTLRAEVEHP